MRESTQWGGSPCQVERLPTCNRRLLRRGNTGWGAAGGEQPVRNKVNKTKTQSEPDSARPTGELARVRRSPCADRRGEQSLGIREDDRLERMRSRAEVKGEREQMAWLRWSCGWGQKGWKWRLSKQGDPPGAERSSWSKGPKNRPEEVRAFVVARKRGNARGAKGRRKVES